MKKHQNLPDAVVDYLLWYHLGTDSCSKNLVSVFKQHFKTQVNKQNMSLLVQAHINRNEIKVNFLD